jgi:hypothetical protein
MPVSDDVIATADPTCPKPKFSSVFRVEKVDDCCCTFRVLKQKKEKEMEKEPEHDEEERFIATDSFFTVDLKCVCVIRCLEDTFVDCV